MNPTKGSFKIAVAVALDKPHMYFPLLVKTVTYQSVMGPFLLHLFTIKNDI